MKKIFVIICKECSDSNLDGDSKWCYNCGKMVETKTIEVVELSKLNKLLDEFEKEFIWETGESVIHGEDWKKLREELK